MKSRSHDITIRIRFSQPVTKAQAQFSAWNALQDHKIWGNGKPERGERPNPHPEAEPFETAKVTVRRSK